MTISTIMERKVKTRRNIKRKAKKEKVRKRRTSQNINIKRKAKKEKRRERSTIQNTGRNPNVYDVIRIHCMPLVCVIFDKCIYNFFGAREQRGVNKGRP